MKVTIELTGSLATVRLQKEGAEYVDKWAIRGIHTKCSRFEIQSSDVREETKEAISQVEARLLYVVFQLQKNNP